MKKLTFSLVFLTFFSILAFSDYIPNGYHTYTVSNIIENTADYPELTWFSYEFGPMYSAGPRFISNGLVHQKSYKFNYLSLYSASNSFLLQKLPALNPGSVWNNQDLTNLTFQAITNNIPQDDGAIISDQTPLISRTYYYRIEGISNQHAVLKLKRRVLVFDDRVITQEY